MSSLVLPQQQQKLKSPPAFGHEISMHAWSLQRAIVFGFQRAAAMVAHKVTKASTVCGSGLPRSESMECTQNDAADRKRWECHQGGCACGKGSVFDAAHQATCEKGPHADSRKGPQARCQITAERFLGRPYRPANSASSGSGTSGRFMMRSCNATLRIAASPALTLDPNHGPNDQRYLGSSR